MTHSASFNRASVALAASWIAKILVGISLISSAFAVISASLLWPTIYFPTICVSAVLLYLSRLFFDVPLPRLVGDAAFFSTIAIYVLAIANSLFLAHFIFTSPNSIWWRAPNAAEFMAGAIAPVGLIFSLILNFTKYRRELFWRGSLAAVVSALVLYAPEYVWFQYHGNRLATGDPETVVSSLSSLAKSPFGVARFQAFVCHRLFLRDINDPFFMYSGTEFLPDRGISKIEEKLRSRFDSEAQKVIEHAKIVFGHEVFDSCPDWSNPNN